MVINIDSDSLFGLVATMAFFVYLVRSRRP